jgi:hypothetical protein
LVLAVCLGTTQLKRAWSGGASAPRGWAAALVPLIPALLSLGLVWDGTFSGGALPGIDERVSLSLLDLAIPPRPVPPEANVVVSEGMLWGAFVFALLLGLWFASRLERLDDWSARFPRVARALSRGLGADAVAQGWVAASAWTGRLITRVGDDALWHHYLPSGLDRAVRAVSGAMDVADRHMAWWIGGVVRPAVEWPARALQRIQSGDVQWYVGIVLFSLLAVIAAFLRGF